MFIPFRNELDETFQSDRSLWLKIGGCSVASVSIIVSGAFRFARQANPQVELTPSAIAILAAGAAILGALLGLGLSLKDTVEDRLLRGDRVHSVLRIYFAGGASCIAAWFVTILFLTMIVTVVGASTGLF